MKTKEEKELNEHRLVRAARFAMRITQNADDEIVLLKGEDLLDAKAIGSEFIEAIVNSFKILENAPKDINKAYDAIFDDLGRPKKAKPEH